MVVVVGYIGGYKKKWGIDQICWRSGKKVEATKRWEAVINNGFGGQEQRH